MNHQNSDEEQGGCHQVRHHIAHEVPKPPTRLSHELSNLLCDTWVARGTLVNHLFDEVPKHNFIIPVVDMGLPRKMVSAETEIPVVLADLGVVARVVHQMPDRSGSIGR